MALQYRTDEYSPCDSYINSSYPDNTYMQEYVNSEMVAKLPSYVVPVLYRKQCDQCTYTAPSRLQPSQNHYQQYVEEARYFSELVGVNKTGENFTSSDVIPSSVWDVSTTLPGEEYNPTMSVRSLYRGNWPESTCTEMTFQPENAEQTVSEISNTITSTDPIMFESSTSIDNEVCEEDATEDSDTSRQVQVHSTNSHSFDNTMHDNEEEMESIAAELSAKQEPPKSVVASDENSVSRDFHYFRLLKIFCHHFLRSLVAMNAYFYKYCLRYILFI